MLERPGSKRPRPEIGCEPERPSKRRLAGRFTTPAARVGLLKLPAELMVMVIEGLKSCKDLNALSRSCLRVGSVAADTLYNRDGAKALFWGAKHGEMKAVAKALKYTSPNVHNTQ